MWIDESDSHIESAKLPGTMPPDIHLMSEQTTIFTPHAAHKVLVLQIQAVVLVLNTFKLCETLKNCLVCGSFWYIHSTGS